MDRILRALAWVRALSVPRTPGRHRAGQTPPVETAVQARESWHAGLPALPGGAAPWRAPAPREPVVPVPPRTPREPFHAGLPARVVPQWRTNRGDTLIDADLVPLVRRYILEHEQHEQRLERQHQQKQQRQRALYLAPGGIDLGPRLIHGAEAAR